MDKIVREISRICGELSTPTSSIVLYVSIPKQELLLFHDGELGNRYRISTSIKPPSCKDNSGGTPVGLHRVEQKIGGEAKAGTVFFSRVSTSQFFWEFDEEIQTRNLITSRILWLKGLEAKKNSGEGVDSFMRFIYIHGTNHEDRLGTVASGGCILMNNQEIIRLYDKVPTGSLVYIDECDSIS